LAEHRRHHGRDTRLAGDIEFDRSCALGAYLCGNGAIATVSGADPCKDRMTLAGQGLAMSRPKPLDAPVTRIVLVMIVSLPGAIVGT
jgi:hypothetical protein